MPGEYLITASSGRKYRVHADDDAGAQRVEQWINERVKAGDHELKDRSAAPWKHAAPGAPKPFLNGLQSAITHGMTLGGSDELAGATTAVTSGAINAISDLIHGKGLSSAGSQFGKAYTAGQKAESDTVNDFHKQHPWGGFGAELLGGLLTGGTEAKAASGLWNTVKAGAKGGAKAGAVSGFLYNDGNLGERTASAGVGSLLGGALGGAIPFASNIVNKTVIQPARNWLNPNNGIGRQVVARALHEDGITPREALQTIQTARSNGVPATMADLGPNARGVASSLSRKPGPSRRIATEAVTERQAGQGERVRDAITRDLGPIADVPTQSDALIQRAKAAAGPLYDKAYKAPPISTPELDAILKTPFGKQATGRARTIAANERRDPSQMGFALDGEGNVILNSTVALGEAADGGLTMTQAPQKVPGFSQQTLDYVKRGMDDVLEQYRNPITGKLNLDEAGRAQNQVKSQLLTEMDRLNPDYAAARKAYQGPARERTALELGRTALNASGSDIERMTGNLSDPEKAQFALGLRSAMSEAIDRKPDAADKVTALLGTPRKRDAMALAMPNAELARFTDTMGSERAANETYRSIMTGSQTANRLADDALTEDGSMLSDLAGRVVVGGVQGGKAGALAELWNSVKETKQFGAGEAGKRAREDAASLLFQSDPALLGDMLRKGLRAQAERRAFESGLGRRSAAAGGLFGRLTGATTGYATTPER